MPNLPKPIKSNPIQSNNKKTGYNSEKHKSINSKFYNSKQWRDLRSMHIRHYPLCKWCEEEGKVVAADVVDHIIEINNGGEKLDSNNLMSMCHPHHNQKTNWSRAKRRRNEV